MTINTKRCFTLLLIKPSHYDDDGYVIQWLNAWIPSNDHARMAAPRNMKAVGWMSAAKSTTAEDGGLRKLVHPTGRSFTVTRRFLSSDKQL